jgi:hypothetical protein
MQSVTQIILFTSRRQCEVVRKLARKYFYDNPKMLTGPFEYLLKNKEERAYLVIDLSDENNEFPVYQGGLAGDDKYIFKNE